ncbi:MAG: hydrogenase 3 maturation endopeptidase HyCI [Candidatus Omnitrophica bacterium]|nr:hydrogenase 3 maturation endopeptidase HyCI [Candidatus Omnitrophota bacterium]
MQELKKALENRLKAAQRVALLAIGSELKGDDAAGLLAVEGLPSIAKFRIFVGATAPENLTGEIKKYNPTHLIIIDCADLQDAPGAVKIFDPEQTTGDSFSTHRLPLKMLAQYLRMSLNCDIMVIGIQPRSIKFSTEVSAEVKHAVFHLKEILQDLIKSLS